MATINEAQWGFKKQITVNSGSALSNYQLKFTVNRSSGTDSGYTVYVSTKCQSDYDDIRFTDYSGTILDCWIESSSVSTADIWVEVGTISSGDTTLYIYYGNEIAPSVSSGTDTFPFFDDFPGTTLDTSKWTTSGSPTTSISNSILTVSSPVNAWHDVYSINTYGVNYSIRSRVLTTHQTDANHHERIGFDNAAETHIVQIHANQNVANCSDGSSTTAAITWVANSYNIVDITRNSTTSGIFNINNIAACNPITTHVPTSNLYAAVAAVYHAGSSMSSDWFLVRKYVSPEPTISTWGSEVVLLNSGVAFGTAEMMTI